MKKRTIEVFTAGCPCCDEVVELTRGAETMRGGDVLVIWPGTYYELVFRIATSPMEERPAASLAAAAAHRAGHEPPAGSSRS